MSNSTEETNEASASRQDEEHREEEPVDEPEQQRRNDTRNCSPSSGSSPRVVCSGDFARVSRNLLLTADGDDERNVQDARDYRDMATVLSSMGKSELPAASTTRREETPSHEESDDHPPFFGASIPEATQPDSSDTATPLAMSPQDIEASTAECIPPNLPPSGQPTEPNTTTTDTPGAQHIPGNRPTDDYWNQYENTTDSSLEEEVSVVIAQGLLVDEQRERARLQQELMRSAPRAEVVDVAAQRRRKRRWRLVYIGGFLILAVGLVVGLVLGLPGSTQRPLNDECVNAIQVGKLPFVHFGETESAEVIETAALNCSDIGAASRGNWFQIAGSNLNTTCINASVTGSDVEPVMAVYEGSCGTLSCFAVSSVGSVGAKEDAFILLPSGRNIYHVLVTGSEGSTGSYRLDVSVRFLKRNP